MLGLLSQEIAAAVTSPFAGLVIAAAKTPPPLPPDSYLWTVLLLAIANPVVWLVGFFMGRHVDQPQKFIVVAFAAAFAGFVCTWLAQAFGLVSVKGYGATGIFIAQMFIGAFAGWLGYYFARKA